jgi:hypothetical protein
LLATIDTLIASNLDNAAVLASIISLVQSIIDRNALSTIGNTSTTLFVTTVPSACQNAMTLRAIWPVLSSA